MPADPLLCLDRLRLGDLEIDRRRAACTFGLTRGRRTESFALRLTWDRPVLDPDDPRSRNLAALALLQPALNYGLFTRELRLDLPLDRTDLGFVRTMLENTSREIYANKIRPDNPFLKPAIRRLPFAPRAVYTRARLVASPGPPLRHRRRPDPRRAAILSSGGKESLLSFGLSRELGLTALPIFYNEAGKHWFTALNAYRHFAATVPGTARVWGNSDRLFAWMNQRLPILRRDWAAIRADEYPLRLWTVAILVFAALPVAVAEGAGRLIIGDEHDTTRVAWRGRVRHHDGLYDQGRFFDATLSRYFRAKGLGIEQLSLLRPLSELLVEKVLAERYPELLDLQVSCHAAHATPAGIRPCGRCEKCRRVVAMLAALGVAEQRLGYPPGTAERVAGELQREPLHQERVLNQHLLHLLAGRGLIERGTAGAVSPEPHPEVEMLRFDRLRSPVGYLPAELDGPLRKLLLEHARGTHGRRRAPGA